MQYQNLSKEERDKRQKKAQVRYQSFTEEEKEKRYQHYVERKKRLPDYRRNYYLAHKIFLNLCLIWPWLLYFSLLGFLYT